MTEYIDKKYLDRKFQIDMMALRSGTIFDTKKIIDSLPTADVIEIPKNATNGDMIKAIFPNIEADEIKTDTGGYIEVKYLDTTDKCDATAFRKNWWNSLYKRGNENENN